MCRKGQTVSSVVYTTRFVKGRGRVEGMEPRVDSTRRGRFHPAVKLSEAFEGRRPQKHTGLLNMRNVEVIATLQSHTASGSRYPHAL